jgi:hypothetical protein
MGDVEFTKNRFYQATDGILYKRPQTKPYPVVSFTADSNTFFGAERGLLFDTMPLDDSAKPQPLSQIVVKNNLFVQTKVLLQCGDLAATSADRVFPPQVGNIRDANGKEGNVSLRSTVGDCAKVIIDQAADKAHLLRYAKDSPLSTAGANGGPVGAGPIE